MYMDERSRRAKQSAEFRAKTLQGALELAAEELRVPLEELDYEIASDTTRSILGLVRTGEVAIRVSLPDVTAKELVPPELPIDVIGPEEQAEAIADVGLRRNPPELEEVASDVLSTLLDKMGILAAVEVVNRGGEVDPLANEVSPLVLNVVGDDLGMLVGRRGETLRDLQFIVRLIVNRRLGVWPNVVVDVENYKSRRENSLRSLATRMADQVRRTGRLVVLEPMPAYERRIIHIALREDADVYTESTGENDSRKVQILPR